MQPEELSRLNVNTKRALREALERGDTEAALALFEDFAAGKKQFHDFAVRWAAMLLEYIGERLGDEAVAEVHRRFARRFRPPVITQWEERYRRGEAGIEDFPIEDFIRQRVALWNLTHDNELDIEEDDEKFILRLKPCQSGGMLQFEYPAEVARTSGSYAWTGLRENFPYYCSHCTVMWERGWFDDYGYPLILFQPPAGHGAPCVQYFYKNPRAIPEELLRERGMTPLPDAAPASTDGGSSQGGN